MNTPFKMKGFSGFGTPFKKITGHGMHPTHGDINEGMTGAEFETKKEREGRVDEYTRTPSVTETLRKRKGEKKRTKLELLKLKYENDIKCPKCKIPLLKHTPQYLIHRKKCPNEKCNAQFFVE